MPPRRSTVDAEIAAAFDPDDLITPDDVRGSHPTLDAAVQARAQAAIFFLELGDAFLCLLRRLGARVERRQITQRGELLLRVELLLGKRAERLGRGFPVPPFR